MMLSKKRGPSAEVMASIFINYREHFYWLLTGKVEPEPQVAGEDPLYTKDRREDHALCIHTGKVGRKLAQVGSAIKDIGKEIENLRIAPNTEGVDFEALKDIFDKEKPPEGVEERRAFMRRVKDIIHCEEPEEELTEGSGI